MRRTVLMARVSLGLAALLFNDCAGSTSAPSNGPVVDPVSVNPAAGVLNGTQFSFTGNLYWQHPSGTDDAFVEYDFGDGSRQRIGLVPASKVPFHVYHDTGTFEATATLTDHWGKTASNRGTVTVVSLTGEWGSSTTADGVYTITQTGTSLEGSYMTGGRTVGQVSGTIGPNSVPENVVGIVTLTLPVQFGTNLPVVNFVGSAAPNLMSGLANDPRNPPPPPGTVTGAQVTLTRK